ncbi:MAG: MFS transporter [Mycolicibacterium sp.]|uniref:MFS transporter n=1 Tax=Mycolicibacterium sp. TaxID=2320850 RepID=UPI003D13E5B3
MSTPAAARPLRVIQWTTGNIGRRSLHAIIGRNDMELVGVYAHGPDKVGVDAAELAGWSEPTGVTATDDIEALLALRPDACCYNPLWPNVDELVRLLESGVNVCSSAAWITGGKQSPEDLDRIRRACEEGNSTIFGKRWLESRLEVEREAAAAGQHWPLRKTLTHPRIWALAFAYFGITYGLYAVGFFLPTIVAGFQEQYGTHLSVVERGLVTSVPFVVAAIVMVPWARHADRTGERVWHVAIPAIVGGVSIPAALYMTDPYLAMLAVTLSTCSVICALPVFWALPSTFLTGVAAAAGIALINSLGNLSGFGGPYITGWLTDLTGSSKLALWVVGVLSLCSAVVVVGLGARPKPAEEPADGAVCR